MVASVKHGLALIKPQFVECGLCGMLHYANEKMRSGAQRSIKACGVRTCRKRVRSPGHYLLWLAVRCRRGMLVSASMPRKKGVLTIALNSLDVTSDGICFPRLRFRSRDELIRRKFSSWNSSPWFGALRRTLPPRSEYACSLDQYAWSSSAGAACVATLAG